MKESLTIEKSDRLPIVGQWLGIASRKGYPFTGELVTDGGRSASGGSSQPPDHPYPRPEATQDDAKYRGVNLDLTMTNPVEDTATITGSPALSRTMAYPQLGFTAKSRQIEESPHLPTGLNHRRCGRNQLPLKLYSARPGMRPFSTVEIPSKKFTRLRFVLVFGACAFLKYKHEAQASECRKCVINGREEYK